MSQSELAQLIGVSKQAVSAVEANKQAPSLSVALKISKVLDVPVENLFSEEDRTMDSPRGEGLSRIDRALLRNQFNILQKLNADNEDLSEHFGRLEQIVVRGYQMFYKDVFRDLWDELTPDQSIEVITILSMHRALYDSLGTQPAPEDLEKVKFRGFDANEESDYLSFAKFFTSDGRTFSELRIFNSHFPMLPRYRRMLAEWKRLGGKPQLSKAQVESIIEAGIFRD